MFFTFKCLLMITCNSSSTFMAHVLTQTSSTIFLEIDLPEGFAPTIIISTPHYLVSVERFKDLMVKKSIVLRGWLQEHGC